MNLIEQFSIFLLMTFLSHCGAFGGGFLFSGHTQNGWQVFAYDLGSSETTQITDSIGDKRIPTFNSLTQRVYFKDSNGRIQFIASNGESGYLLNEQAGCSSYVVSPSGDSIYFTRLATGNTQRQFIWKASISFNDEEVRPSIFWRPDTRSARQLAIGPSGKWLLATHIKSIETEQILKLPLNKESAPQYVTSSSGISVYPVLSSDASGFYYSKQISERNFDLFYKTFANSKEVNLTNTLKQSEFGASLDPEQQILFYEVRSGTSNQIHRLDLKQNTSEPLDIAFPACEPHYLSSSEFHALKDIISNHEINNI